MEPASGAAVQTLRWQTLILHAKEESTGFKRHQVEERGMFSVKYVPCFRSDQAIDWLLANNYASSRSEAVIVGNSMLTDFQIAQVPKTKNAAFKDESQFYRWLERAERAKLVSKKGKQLPATSKGSRSVPSSTQPSPPESKYNSQRASMIIAEPPSMALSPSTSSDSPNATPLFAPVELGTDVTREEWVRWLMVTPSPEDRTSFICSYIGWMTPEEMFLLLNEAYKNMRPSFSQRQQETLEKQTLEFMREWLGSTHAQGLLSASLMEMVNKFASSQLSGLGTLKLVKMVQEVQMMASGDVAKSRRLSASITGTQRGRSSSGGGGGGVRSSLAHEVHIMDPKTGLRAKSLLLQDDVSAREIAETLTMVEFQLFKRLQPCELIGGVWQKAEKGRKAPTVVAFTERFNALSNWATAEVVLAADPNLRAKALEKALKVAQICLDMHSFNSAIELLTGVTSFLADRALKHANLTQKVRQHYDEITTIIDPVGNWKNLNERINTLFPIGKKRDTPVLPFLAPNLTVLVQLGEVMPSWLDEERTRINVNKMHTLSSRIMNILRFQTPEYNLPVSKRVEIWLAGYQEVTEKELEAHIQSVRAAAATAAPVHTN